MNPFLYGLPRRYTPRNDVIFLTYNDISKIMNKRFIKIPIIIFSSIAAIFCLGVVIMTLKTKTPGNASLKNSKKGFVIPWSNKGYIAQGITYDFAKGNFYLTGYMKDGSASPILVVNKKSGKLINVVRMANPDGSDYAGHAGGLALMNGKLYVAGSHDSCFYVFKKSDIEKAEKNSAVSYSEVLDLKKGGDQIGVAYCTTRNGLIYAGEFYRNPQYILSEKHQVQTSDGLQYALAVGFEINPDGKTTTAKIAYSIPVEIQGMCFEGNTLYLTTSWGLEKSFVYKYNLDKIPQSGTKEVCGETVPLYNLTMQNMEACYTLPSMAEEIEYVDGHFYINNESASDKYVFGKFTGGRWCRGYKFN